MTLKQASLTGFSVPWVGGASTNNWSNASNWAGGAIPTFNNVAHVIIPNKVRVNNLDVDVNVVYDSALVGQIGSTIENNGKITFNGSSAFEFGNAVSGAGSIVQSGDGELTISGNNTLTGNLEIANTSTLLGWHVIKVNDRRSYRFPPLDEVRNQISDDLAKQKRMKYLAKLRQAAKINQ